LYTRCFGENLKEVDNLEDTDVNGRIIYDDLQELGCRGEDWIDLAQERYR